MHFGWQRRAGHKIPIHDEKAWTAIVKFAQDFKPDTWIHGGDMLDCSCISHHNKGKPGQTEGLKLLADATEGRKLFIDPVEEICKGDLIYVCGNHEAWLSQFTDEYPALEGIIDLKSVLKLEKRWEVIPQGGAYKLGKLNFIHGDQLKGGENAAKAAVLDYERNIRFGHLHSHTTFTKTSPLDSKYGKTGIGVPCICRKDMEYGKGRPNRWSQGFLYGYLREGGYFNDYVVTIVDGTFVVNGKLYKG